VTWRWLVFWLLSPVGALFFVANCSALLAWLIRQKRSSGIPLIGGAALAIAMGFAPSPALRPWWWLPLALDPGCLLLAINAGLLWARSRFRS
jgi:hypothetical protein